MNRARLLVSLVGLALVACQDNQPVAPTVPDGPVFQIRDGHDVGGNPGFFFLAPIRRLADDATVPKTGFNPDLAPVIEVYECRGTSATGCVLPLGALKSRITKTSGIPLLNRLYVLPNFHEYAALWDTKNLALRTDRTYRIQVLVGGQVLGFADVDVVRTIRELSQVDRDAFVPLLQNFILPIRFWIGNNALCTGACSSETITLAAGGTVELDAAGEVFKFDIAVGTTATSGGQPVTEVTFSLETCSGIDVDLPKFGQCLRVATRFGGAGTTAALQLNTPALVSLCVLEPGLPQSQEDFITLHQQDGDLVRALPHAIPNCDAPIPSPRLGARGWQWLRDFAARLFTPQPLYARSRTALFNLGGGGQTHLLGATCTPSPSPMPGGMALATCVPGVAPQLATPLPSSGHTISDFQFALPAKMDYVDPDDASRSATTGTRLATAVKVTDWAGAAVQGATVTFTAPAIEGPGTVIGTATSNSDGFAEISWLIAAGSNNVIASGRGIAARNNYEGTVKPFMPDISQPVAQQATVIVRDGAVPFAATGTPPAGLIDCAGDPSGDQIDRGFYIPEYPGISLNRATLHFSADVAGTYTFSLTARDNTYDGQLLGTATASVTLTANTQANVATTFTFSAVAVEPGSTVTFAIAPVSGPAEGTVFYSVPSLGDESCPVIETNGTTPPRDTFRRQGVHVRIEGATP